MKTIYKPLLTLCTLSLMACGGGGGGSVNITPPTSNGPVVTVSATSVTLDGKQFGEQPTPERISINYDTDVVTSVGLLVTGNAKFEGRNIFSVSADSSNSFADILIDNTDIPGGTYQDELVLSPNLRANGTTPSITIDLTFIQEPTEPITGEINDPDNITVQITEGGPQVRVEASVNTGSTIRWEVQPYRFIADDVDAVTSDPTAGVGSEQITLIITPTPALINSIRSNGQPEIGFLGLQDIDHPGNFSDIGVDIELIETAE